MHSLLLHYIHDPLCGWCYAASPLVKAAAGDGVEIALHGGNLWAQATRLTSEKQRYILQSDDRIAELTGVPFGAAYRDKLLGDADTVFWSRPPISAILAAASLRKGADLEMLHAIQTAHYLDGKRVVDGHVLAALAQQVGLESRAFLEAFRNCPVDAHIQDSRSWMSRFGLRGFPGFVLEHQGRHARVSHESFYGKPDDFVRQLHVAAMALG